MLSAAKAAVVPTREVSLRSDPEPSMVMPPAPAFITQEPYVLGFDISHHQVVVEFEAMFEQGYRFCFLKATEGNTFRDKMFANHAHRAHQAGLHIGAYHFARVRRDDDVSFLDQGIRQARFCAKTVRESVPKGCAILPIVLDVEWHDSLKTGKILPPELITFISAFNLEIERLGFSEIIVYTGPSFYKQYIKRPLTYKLWLVSGYNRKFKPTKVIPDWNANFYQFYNKQPVPHRNTDRGLNIDVNVFYGTETDLAGLLRQV
jgi:lysozyme